MPTLKGPKEAFHTGRTTKAKAAFWGSQATALTYDAVVGGSLLAAKYGAGNAIANGMLATFGVAGTAASMALPPVAIALIMYATAHELSCKSASTAEQEPLNPQHN